MGQNKRFGGYSAIGRSRPQTVGTNVRRMAASDSKRRGYLTSRWARALCVCLLLVFFGQLAFGARHLSLTADEPAHITRGYAYLTSDDFWMLPILGHPPLVEGWAALPLLLDPDHPCPADVPHWRESTALYIQSLLPYLGGVEQIEVLTRVPVMLLATLLMALTFRWASELAGGWAGVCAAALMAWDPTMIAHAQLDTTDLGVTLFSFACAYAFWRMARTDWNNPRSTTGWLVATGVLTGMALTAKHTGMIALLLMGLLVVWGWLWTVAGGVDRASADVMPAKMQRMQTSGLSIDRASVGAAGRRPGRSIWRRLISEAWRWGKRGIVILLLSVLVVWAVYRFETERIPGFPWIIPFPSHIQSLRALFESKDRIAFLRGHLREGGWWWYTPYVFLIKTPLPFLAAILLSVWKGLRRLLRWREGGSRTSRMQVSDLRWKAGLRDVAPLPLERRRSDGAPSPLERRRSDGAPSPLERRRSDGAPSSLERRRCMSDVPLWLFPVLYWGITMAAGMHIGYRHLLPTFPFVYVLVGRGLGAKRTQRTIRPGQGAETAPLPRTAGYGRIVPIRRLGRWVTVALAAWYVVGTWLVYPYTVAYFNELVGGPANGYTHVVDSNLDWGHGFKALADAMRREGIPEVHLSYWTWVDPASYGVPHTPLPPAPQTEEGSFPSYAPPPGVYAISATTLQGILLHDTDLYEWFRHQQPIAQPGYGLMVYRVEEREPAPTWVGQCATPAPPLPPSEIERGFGGQVQRVAYFDCTQSWLYPDGGRSAGWYVFHEESLGQAGEWIDSCLCDARLSYAHTQPGTLPAYRIHEWDPSAMSAFSSFVSSGMRVPHDGAAVGDKPVSDGQAEYSLSAPVSFDGPLTLRGYRVVQDGAPSEWRLCRGDGAPSEECTFELQTWWEVNSPTSRLFSLMGHALDQAGNVVGVADGLGVPLTEMRAGDWIVQRHRFTLEDCGGAVVALDDLCFQTGGYWLDTMERWPVLVDGTPVGDRVLLTDVGVSQR